MSPKELLYIEDALNHEQFLKAQIAESGTKLADADLKNFVSSLACSHNDIYQCLYKSF